MKIYISFITRKARVVIVKVIPCCLFRLGFLYGIIKKTVVLTSRVKLHSVKILCQFQAIYCDKLHCPKRGVVQDRPQTLDTRARARTNAIGINNV